jgi:hypothetical protein
VRTIAAAAVADTPTLELVADPPARTDWREHLAVRLAYGLACAMIAMLIPGEWERFCGPTAPSGRSAAREP